MRIIDVLNAPWAIEPHKLLEIQSIYASRLAGEVIDIEAIEARLGRPLANQKTAAQQYEVVDGVAVLSIDGVMAKRMNMFSQISGGTSTQLLCNQLRAAVADQAIHSIILSIDSPGGTVDGTQLLADEIRAASQKKQVMALASGSMASAAYWAGSAAAKVYITDSTTAVGSIGVVTSHVDVSGSEQAKGIKTTEISAGKFKRIASQYAPLTEEGRQSIQDQLDYTYSLFVGAVAQNRGVSEDKVLSDMADGRIFIGQQAVQAGLVDGIATLDQLVIQLNQGRSTSSFSIRSRANAAQSTYQPKGITMLTAEQVAAEHPDVAAALRAQGASAERERIQAIEALGIPGHEALINTLKFDGSSTAGDAAQAILAAEKTVRQQAAKAFQNDAPAPVNTVPAAVGAVESADAQASDATPLSKEALDAKAKQHMADNPGTSYIDAYKAVGGR